MIKKMKNISKVLLIVLVLCLSVSACKKDKGDDNTGGQTPSVEITKELLEALPFNDLTVAYDGNKHSILIDNIYEDQGVTITYTNNEQTTPGTYNVSAAIKCDGVKTVYKRAVLTIEKGLSSIEVPETQTFNLSTGTPAITYTNVHNTKQNLVVIDENGKQVKVSELVKPGVYALEVYLPSNVYYNESNHVNVEFTVIKSQFDVVYESKKVIADGNTHTLELTGTIPSGYTVEYENNSGSVDGKYFAVAKIKDSSGNLVETHRAVLEIDNPENEEFKEYLDEFFVWYLEGDQLAVNVYCENPINFGLEHYEAKWYTYTPITQENIEHDLKLFIEELENIKQYEEQPLNNLQETMYETLYKFLEYYVNYYSINDVFYMEILYIDQFGGYVADFGTYMESYSLRSEVEVKDIVDYIESTTTAFHSYLDFVEAKTQHGYPLSNFTINEMRSYLLDIIEQGNNYYLKDIINEKIDKLDFLSASQKTQYKNDVAYAIEHNFIPAVQDLYDGLASYLDLLPTEEEGYLSTYENGKETYLLGLKRLLGYSDLDIEDYIDEIDYELKAAIRDVMSAQSTIISKYGVSTYDELEAIIGSVSVGGILPSEMMEYLKEFAKTIVPELKSNPDIVISNMDDAAAKKSNAVAYYMKSEIDNNGSEYITLNPVKLKDSPSMDTLDTLAHEGYPGHLYAYVFSKELGLSNIATIMTSTAHAEGWATYVQLKLYEYIKENSNEEKTRLVMDYLYANQMSAFLLEARLDAGIQYEGWGVNEVANYMNYIGYNGDAAQEIYDLLIEIPTQYASYGVGKLVFVKLHEKAKKVLGGYYDEIEFNTMLLSKGWTDLEILEDTYEEYMIAKCHECGIAYN